MYMSHCKKGSALVGFIIAVLVLSLAGFFIARLAQTPTMSPEGATSTPKTTMVPKTTSSAKLPSSAPIPQESAFDTDGVMLIRYRENGFSPSMVTIRVGKSLRFRNESTKSLWVTSDVIESTGENYYRDLDQSKSIAHGASFTLNVNRVGVFPFKNLNNALHRGTIVVTP